MYHYDKKKNKRARDKGNEIGMNMWLECDQGEIGVRQEESGLWEEM